MSILNNMLKAFSEQIDKDKDYYRSSEYDKQRRGEYNMIDICDEIERNYNIIKSRNK